MSYMVRIPTNFYTYNANFTQPTTNDATQITFDEYKQQIGDLLAHFQSSDTNIHDQYLLLYKIKQLMEEKDASKPNWLTDDQAKADKLEADVKAILATETMRFPVPIVYNEDGSPELRQKSTLGGDIVKDKDQQPVTYTFQGADGEEETCYLGILTDSSGHEITAEDILNNLDNTTQYHCNFGFDADTHFGKAFYNYPVYGAGNREQDGDLGWKADNPGSWPFDAHETLSSTDLYGKEDATASTADRMHMEVREGSQEPNPVTCQVSGDSEAVARQCVAVKSDGYDDALATLILDYNS